MARPYPFAKTNPAGHHRRPVAPQRGRPASDAAYRKTGINLLGDVPWGAHVCLCYETKQDLIDANVAWFKEGLAARESCLWAVSEPITVAEAKAALRAAIPGFRHLADHDIEIIPGKDWALAGRMSELGGLIRDWHDRQSQALASGHPGLRLSGNALWEHAKLWKNFTDYERMLDASIAGRRILLLCTYSLGASGARDILDMARFHQCAIARREGKWEFLQVPNASHSHGEARLRTENSPALPAFRGREQLTPREIIVLAQIMRGASNKEIARGLKISPRTVEFHRANIMQKLDVKNAVGLVRLVSASH